MPYLKFFQLIFFAHTVGTTFHYDKAKYYEGHTLSPNFFRGGYRTKMKIWSDENEKLVGKFLRASGAQKKGFPNFSPAADFFRRGGTENR